jgi:hypothetical protein
VPDLPSCRSCCPPGRAWRNGPRPRQPSAHYDLRAARPSSNPPPQRFVMGLGAGFERGSGRACAVGFLFAGAGREAPAVAHRRHSPASASGLGVPFLGLVQEVAGDELSPHAVRIGPGGCPRVGVFGCCCPSCRWADAAGAHRSVASAWGVHRVICDIDHRGG